MNKLGKRKYVKLVAETLTEVYGDTLREGGTDVKMAEAVIRELKRFLYFHPLDMKADEYREWKKSRKNMEE